MNKYDKGFISLYRQFKNWRYYKNDNIKSVFIHCLLSAYWKDEVISEYKGKKIEPPIEIPKGSFITSRRKLAEDLEKTDGEIQEALRKLSGYKRCTNKNTNTYTNINNNEITLLCTSQYTVVTINNFNAFQGYIEVSAPGKESAPMLSITPSDTPAITPQLNNIYLNKDKKDIKDKKDKSTNVHSSNLNSLTLKLLKTHYIEESDIPEVYDEMFNDFLSDYEYNHINVVLSYILRKINSKTIRHKYSYLKKSLSINLEKMNEIMVGDKEEDGNPADNWTPIDDEKLIRMIEELQKGESL